MEASGKKSLSDEAQPPPDAAAPMKRGASKSAWWRPVVLLAVIIGVLVLAKLFGLGEKLEPCGIGSLPWAHGAPWFFC